MKRFSKTSCFLVICGICCLRLTVSAAEYNWPQWRGPNRDDISQETGLLNSWPENGPRQVWTFDRAGLGYAGPAIVDGILFVMGTTDTTPASREVLFAIDVNSGQQIWQTPLGNRLENGWGDGPRGTPAVDGDHVYCMGGQGELVCARISDGSIAWQKNMQEDFSGKIPNWGYCESVLVDGDQVVCCPGNNAAAVVALNKKTGETIWSNGEVDSQVDYSSIIKINFRGKSQYIKLCANELVGLDPDTGSMIWTSDWPGQTAVVPTPIFDAGFVFVSSGYGVGCKLIKLLAAMDAETVYDNTNMKNHHGGVLLVGDHLYGYSDGIGWTCMKFLTGEIVWNEKSALGKGAIAYADGMLYCLEENTGTVALVEASSSGWNEHGRLTPQPLSENRSARGKVWTHPVICNGKLYLRDQEFVYCYDVKP